MNNNINILPTNLTPYKTEKNSTENEDVKIATAVEDTVIQPASIVNNETKVSDESDKIEDMHRHIEIDEEDVTVEGGNDYLDDVIIDNFDTTKQDDFVSTYEFNDEDIKNVFYGSSNFQHKKEELKEDSDLFTVFDFYRKESKYKDVYLPVTNVAVRIYEFNNLDILINKLKIESEKDFTYRGKINLVGTQTRDFVQAIFDNSEFITSDKDQLTPVHFELISSLDIPFLVLAATVLMGEIYDATNGASGHKIMDRKLTDENGNTLDIWQDTCDNCQNLQNLYKNVEEILKAQYTEDIVDYANKNYDPNDTLENNIRRSKKVKAKGVRYTKGDSGIETVFLMKDPDWIRSYEYDNAYDNYMLNKYLNNKYLKDIPKKLGIEWVNMTNREKVAQLQETVSNLINGLNPREDTLSFEELRGLTNKMTLDLQNFTLAKYLHMVKVNNTKKLDQNKKPTKISEINLVDYTLEQKMDLLSKYITDELADKMFQQISKIREFGKDTIEYKWKCAKCGHDNVSNLDPIMFVFLLLQSKLWKREKALSTT